MLSFISFTTIELVYRAYMETSFKRGFQRWLANALGIAEPRLSMVINDKRPMTIDIARRLKKQFPETVLSFWLDMPLLQLEKCLWCMGKKQYMESIGENQNRKGKKHAD